MYKRGTKIIYNVKHSYSDLTYNKTYIIKSSYLFKDGDFIVQIVTDNNTFQWCNFKEFRIGITEERKQKLNELCSKSEIE